MAIYTVSITDGTTLANLAVSAGRGPKGDGFTGVTFDNTTKTFTFTSNDGLGFTSDPITIDLLADPTPQLGGNLDLNSNDITGTGDINITGGMTLTGAINGPSTFTIDPAGHGDNTGTVIIAGNLQVDGTTTTINSQTLDVADLNITVASGAADAASADGAGLTVDGANATLTYVAAGDKWSLNKPLDVTGTITGTSFASTGDMTFGDNDKAIFGAGSDLQIFHDGLNSYVRDAGTGLMIIQGSAEVRLGNPSGETMLRAFDNGAVQLNHDNSLKLATTATGIDVTGTVTADGLTLGGNILRDVDTSSVIISGGNAAATGANAIFYGSTSGNVNDILLRRNNVKFAAFDGATGDISFYEDTGTTPKFFWDASAERLGIGTSSPSRKLSIYDATAPTFNLQNSTSGTGSNDGLMMFTVGADATLVNYETGSLVFATTGSEAMRITSSGNVGIGVVPYSWSNLTALQLERASVSGGDPDTYFTSNGYYSTTAPSGWKYGSATTATQMYMNASGGEFVFRNATSGTANAAISWSERMRIDSSGNLLVGTTIANGIFAVANNGGGYTAFLTGGSGGQNIAVRGGTTTGTCFRVFNNVGSDVGSIDYTSTATSYTTSSDYRLKEDVKPLIGSSDRVLALKPSNFAWKADGSRTDGFIAHEVQEVAPYAVTGEKDGEKMQAMDHSKLVPLLTAALQEALTKIEALEARITALEA